MNRLVFPRFDYRLRVFLSRRLRGPKAKTYRSDQDFGDTSLIPCAINECFPMIMDLIPPSLNAAAIAQSRMSV